MDSSHLIFSQLRRENFKAHNRLSTKSLVIASFLVAMNIVLTRLGAIMLFGGTIRLSFGNIPLVLSGMLLGPVAGAMVGFVSDMLGFMINSHGSAFHPGFTLSSVLTGVIPGIIVMFSRKTKLSTLNILISNILVFLIVSLGLNTYWLTHLFGKSFFVLLPTRIIASTIIAIINTIIILILVKNFKQTNVINFTTDDRTTKQDLLYVVSFIFPFFGVIAGYIYSRNSNKNVSFWKKLLSFSLKILIVYSFILVLFLYHFGYFTF